MVAIGAMEKTVWRHCVWILVVGAAVAALGCEGGGGGSGDNGDAVNPGGIGPGGIGCDGGDCRQAMRDFVQSIGTYARNTNLDFLVIPQNGHDLITANGLGSGPPATAYLSAINGVGREDLFFGYVTDDVATPAAERDAMIALLDVARDIGVKPLVTDYVASGSANIAASYASNVVKGYVSFAAIQRNLAVIPPTGVYYPYLSNASAITSLATAKNFLYLLDPTVVGGDRAGYVTALAATDYDVLIIDAFYADGFALSPTEVTALKTKPGGLRRLVIAYMSIGEAENYRDYWLPGWAPGNPSFIVAENPDWPGNFKVKYWDPTWQAVIYGNTASYTQKLLDAGFDGAYLDLIDAFGYFE